MSAITKHISHAMMSIVIVFALISGTASARVMPSQIRFYDEAVDTTRLTKILTDVEAMHIESPGERVAVIGRMFIGTPYVAHTLECDSTGDELLTVNISQLDCTTFVETVAAMAITIGDRRTSWRDFVYTLERLRYRGGEMNGYASRLHYICDWVINNSSRGLITDVTDRFPSVRYAVKTIDYMSRHRASYPALADSATYERILSVEQVYHNHRYPYIRTIDTNDKKTIAYLRNGDIVAFTSSLKDLDVTHMGIIIKGSDGVPHVLHASSSLGRVVLTDVTLYEFLHRNRSLTGIRVLRLQ